MKKALVGIVIQKALLSIGNDALNIVEKRLEEDYSCTFPDCYEHPEYLTRILKELYGNAHIQVIDSIKKQLHDWMRDESISDFALKISR